MTRSKVTIDGNEAKARLASLTSLMKSLQYIPSLHSLYDGRVSRSVVGRERNLTSGAPFRT